MVGSPFSTLSFKTVLPKMLSILGFQPRGLCLSGLPYGNYGIKTISAILDEVIIANEEVTKRLLFLTKDVRLLAIKSSSNMATMTSSATGGHAYQLNRNVGQATLTQWGLDIFYSAKCQQYFTLLKPVGNDC